MRLAPARRRALLPFAAARPLPAEVGTAGLAALPGAARLAGAAPVDLVGAVRSGR